MEFYCPFITKEIRDCCIALFGKLTKEPQDFFRECYAWDDILKGVQWKFPEANCVYFFEREKAVKIGITKNVYSRMKTLITASDGECHLRLCVPVENRRDAEWMEKYFQGVWLGKKLKGEWFEKSDEEGYDLLYDLVGALYHRGEKYYQIEMALRREKRLYADKSWGKNRAFNLYETIMQISRQAEQERGIIQ